MVTPGAQNVQPRCRECAEDLAGVVRHKLESVVRTWSHNWWGDPE
jgi:hypothetical protein